MGLGGGLVKKVFSKSSRSLSAAGVRDSNERTPGADKGRWSLVRLKFCGDDFDSVAAEDDDSASFRSSEATVTQPVAGEAAEATVTRTMTEEASEASVTLPWAEASENEHEIKETKSGEQGAKEEKKSPTKFSEEEDAVIIIQSAFRGFRARRRHEQIRQPSKSDSVGDIECLSRLSLGTSIEVQVGDSTDHPIISQDESATVQHGVPHKARTQVSRLKEEWDDSTVSSNISKLRIQSRLEAMTRRERALAYAFSQQLRTCSTKKRPTWSDSEEPNVGWSWLERWMATRVPENSSVEDCMSRHLEPVSSNRRSAIIIKKRFDVAVEEKESCGSNDVSVCFENLTVPSQTITEGHRPVRNRLKSPRSVSRRKTVPSNHHYMAQSNKITKRGSFKEAEKEKRQANASKEHGGSPVQRCF